MLLGSTVFRKNINTSIDVCILYISIYICIHTYILFNYIHSLSLRKGYSKILKTLEWRITIRRQWKPKLSSGWGLSFLPSLKYEDMLDPETTYKIKITVCSLLPSVLSTTPRILAKKLKGCIVKLRKWVRNPQVF
jgi:hypothetical protein